MDFPGGIWGSLHIEEAGAHHVEREIQTMYIADSYQTLLCIITVISDAALLTPATVNEILVQSRR